MMKKDTVSDESISAAADWFARQRGGAMSARAQREMEDWLNADARHRLALARCEQLALMTTALREDPQLNADLVPRQRTRRWHWLGAAAAVLLVALAALVLQRHYALDYYSTRIGEQRLVRLDDGSSVMLNTNSRVGVRYTRGQRSLYLERGEAYFEVAKNPHRPFVVHAGGSEVRALGTAFNVALIGGDLRVAVTHGLVGVSAPDAAGNRRRLVELKPGQGTRYPASKPPARAPVEPANLERVTAWQASRIYFDNDRLEDAIADYNRYTTRKLVLVGDKLADERISGVFNIGDTDALLFALRQSFDVRLRKSDRRVLVMASP